MNKEELKRKAWNYIADYDETSRIIPDGNIDDAAELIADFIEHLNILKPNELKGVSNNEQTNEVCSVCKQPAREWKDINRYTCSCGRL